MPAKYAQHRRAVAKIAAFDRHHPQDHDTEARARLVEELRAAQKERWVQETAAAAAELTDEQRARLARLLLGES